MPDIADSDLMEIAGKLPASCLYDLSVRHLRLSEEVVQNVTCREKTTEQEQIGEALKNWRDDHRNLITDELKSRVKDGVAEGGINEQVYEAVENEYELTDDVISEVQEASSEGQFDSFWCSALGLTQQEIYGCRVANDKDRYDTSVGILFSWRGANKGLSSLIDLYGIMLGAKASGIAGLEDAIKSAQDNLA